MSDLPQYSPTPLAKPESCFLDMSRSSIDTDLPDYDEMDTCPPDYVSTTERVRTADFVVDISELPEPAVSKPESTKRQRHTHTHTRRIRPWLAYHKEGLYAIAIVIAALAIIAVGLFFAERNRRKEEAEALKLMQSMGIVWVDVGGLIKE